MYNRTGKADLETGSQGADSEAQWSYQEMDPLHSWCLLQYFAWCLSFMVSGAGGSGARAAFPGLKPPYRGTDLRRHLFRRSFSEVPKQISSHNTGWDKMVKNPLQNQPQPGGQGQTIHSCFAPWNWGGKHFYLNPVRVGTREEWGGEPLAQSELCQGNTGVVVMEGDHGQHQLQPAVTYWPPLLSGLHLISMLASGKTYWRLWRP